MASTKCISVSEELSKLASEFHISWSEAAKLGARMMLAEIGIVDYPTNLRLYQNLQKAKQRLLEEIDKNAK